MNLSAGNLSNAISIVITHNLDVTTPDKNWIIDVSGTNITSDPEFEEASIVRLNELPAGYTHVPGLPITSNNTQNYIDALRYLYNKGIIKNDVDFQTFYQQYFNAQPISRPSPRSPIATSPIATSPIATSPVATSPIATPIDEARRIFSQRLFNVR